MSRCYGNSSPCVEIHLFPPPYKKTSAISNFFSQTHPTFEHTPSAFRAPAHPISINSTADSSNLQLFCISTIYYPLAETANMLPFGAPITPIVPINGVIIPIRRPGANTSRNVGRVEGYAAAMRDMRAMERMKAMGQEKAADQPQVEQEPAMDAYGKYQQHRAKHYEYRAMLAPESQKDKTKAKTSAEEAAPETEKNKTKTKTSGGTAAAASQKTKTSSGGTAVTQDDYDKYQQHRAKHYEYRQKLAPAQEQEKTKTSSGGTAASQDAYDKYQQHRAKHYEYREKLAPPQEQEEEPEVDAYQKYQQHRAKHYQYREQLAPQPEMDAYQRYQQHRAKHYEYREALRPKTSGGTQVTEDAAAKYRKSKARESQRQQWEEQGEQEMQQRPSRRRVIEGESRL